MPLVETQPDAIASVYAQSLFELANARGGQAAVEEALGELEDFVELARADARFGEFISSRIIAQDDRARTLESILKDRMNPEVMRFLLVLNSKGRLASVTGVVAAYDRLVQNAFGRVEVDVFTAAPLSDDDRRALAVKLRAALGREPVLHPYVDGSIIGGLRLQIGDQLVDGSIATALRRMKEQINTRGSAIVRASSDRIIDSGYTNGTVN